MMMCRVDQSSYVCNSIIEVRSVATAVALPLILWHLLHHRHNKRHPNMSCMGKQLEVHYISKLISSVYLQSDNYVGSYT